MQLYVYDQVTKEYLGSMPVCLDPLESELKGEPVYAKPPFCTEKEPLKAGEWETVLFNEATGEWFIEKDYRGRKVYNEKTGAPFIVEKFGELPEGFILDKPVIIQDLKQDKFHELNEAFAAAQEVKVKVKGIELNLRMAGDIRGQLINLGDIPELMYATEDGQVVSIPKEDAEYIEHYFLVRTYVLPIRKAEIAKAIRNCKTANELAQIKLDFNIDEIVKDLASKPKEELDKFISVNTK